MNPVLQQIPPYLSKKISDVASKDPEIVNLSIGEPYFKPPELVTKRFLTLAEAQLASGDFPNKYAPSKGAESLREAVAKRYQRLYHANFDPETEILITHGAIEAIWLCLLALSAPGDEVLIPDPTYNLYETAVRLLHRVPVRIATRLENGFVLDPADLKAAISPRCKLLFINSPENPTGAVYPREVFREIGAMAEKHGFYILHDEVYDSFLFEGTHYNLLREGAHPPYLVLLNSFSKRYSMMGWRLGWMVASEAVIAAALKVHTNLTLNLVAFQQEAASVLLNDPEVEADTAAHVRRIAVQIGDLYEALSAHEGFRLLMPPKGAFFLFPEVSEYFQALSAGCRERYPTPGEAVAAHLLEYYKIAVVPGYVYGPSGANHVRWVGAAAMESTRLACERLQFQSFRFNSEGKPYRTIASVHRAGVF